MKIELETANSEMFYLRNLFPTELAEEEVIAQNKDSIDR